MRIRRRFASIALTILAVVAGVFALFRPDRAASSGVGLTAHTLCSAVFISRLEPEPIFLEHLTPLMGRIPAALVDFQVDRRRRVVTAKFAGIAHARAIFTEGYGCRLDLPGNRPAPRPVDRGAPPLTPLPVKPDTELTLAVDRVFAERPGAPPKRVKALVVVRDGSIVAERYAPGYGTETPMLSYSVAKSVTNALVGVLVQEERLRLDETAFAPEWGSPTDPRRRIAVEDLLRMRSGLDAPEEGGGADPVTRMLFTQPDMASFAAGRPLRTAPATEWEYTSANTLILDRLIGQRVGGRPAGLRAFAGRKLFVPLGMGDVTMEFDGAGTFVGSSYIYATTRAFARFGMLYLSDGIAPNGQRLLPSGWARWSARSTLGRGYGAGFWTNDGASQYARQRVEAGFPRDGFYASGNLGQRIYIVPSARLVVVRFGLSSPPEFGIDDDIGVIAAAVRSGSQR